jgi:hypothetical protein
MSNKKKSSIDLFAIALYEKGFLKGNGDEINDLLEEHKAMHKEECAEVFKEAQECAVKHDGVYFKYNSIEDYYKSKETELESLPCELESLSNIKQHEVTWIAALDYAIEKMKGLNNAESIDAFKKHYNETFGGEGERHK